MFEWLAQELAEVKTKQFHKVSPPDARLSRRIKTASLPVPGAYREFSLRFGDSWLYRTVGRDQWRMRIFGAPHEAVLKRTGETAYLIGWRDDSHVYFRPTLPSGSESPVFESVGKNIRKVADGFGEWLNAASQRMRKSYGKRGWAKVVRGPDAFTAAEQAIAEARRRFSWRYLGVTRDGKLRFEVSNGSTTTLPYLSVGVRAPGLLGGVYLPVSHVLPGQTAVIERDGYRSLVDPSTQEAFAKPAPEPENREEYWEFRRFRPE